MSETTRIIMFVLLFGFGFFVLGPVVTNIADKKAQVVMVETNTPPAQFQELDAMELDMQLLQFELDEIETKLKRARDIHNTILTSKYTVTTDYLVTDSAIYKLDHKIK